MSKEMRKIAKIALEIAKAIVYLLGGYFGGNALM